MTTRKALPTNIARQLWAQCGGYCQNPRCNKYLFAEIDEDIVSLANIAHIIGHGQTGPRTEHELASFIEKDGINNLIMLCLDCHKIIDELEGKFSVEDIMQWKSNHIQRIQSIFSIQNITIESDLLREVSDLLDENYAIFKEYGPFSVKALQGDSGDAKKIWRRRCLDTIIPNNQRILNLIERNKRNFSYPWDLYQYMLDYKMHVEAFRENCFLAEKVNDYKLFPQEFNKVVKKKLGFPVGEVERRSEEELEFRNGTVESYMRRFLANHSAIKYMEEWNKATLFVSLRDGRNLRVFITNTYFFTEYTLGKILTINPNIDVIICSNPYSTYTPDAKEACINQNIGLFNLKEFMGAIRITGEQFLNYLVGEEKRERIDKVSSALKQSSLGKAFKVYLFGSFLRRKLYRDIDFLLVYNNSTTQRVVDKALDDVRLAVSKKFEIPSHLVDITACSDREYISLTFINDNRVQVQ